jgi:cytochrome c oxidase subunit 2
MTDATVPETPPGESGEVPSFEIDPLERHWMRFSAVLLLAFLATVTTAGFFMGFQVAGAEQEVDPRTILETQPWSEPGLREVAPGEYEAYVIAQAWNFSPRELEIPVGSTVDIYVTSPDLQHGFKITDTNINMQVVPGQVSKLTFTFDDIGEFPYLCTEYCGQGHAAMFGVVNVVDPAADGDTETTETEADEG